MKLGRDPTEFTGLYTPSTYSFDLKECILGERLSDELTCEVCIDGQYTFGIGAVGGCVDCPDGGICQGLNIFGSAKDYWKFSYESATVVACRNDRACLGAIKNSSTRADHFCMEQRVEDPSFCYTGWCEEGYTGHLCAECEEGYAYANTNTKTCTRCNDNTRYYVISALLAMGGTIYIIIVIRSALKSEEQKDEEAPKLNKQKENDEKSSQNVAQERDQQSLTTTPIKPETNRLDSEVIPMADLSEIVEAEVLSSNKESDIQALGEVSLSDKHDDMQALDLESSLQPVNENESKNEKIQKDTIEEAANDVDMTSVYLKILTNYFQFISIIGTFDFDWPELVKKLIGISTQISQSSENFFTFDCLLRQPIFKEAGLTSYFSKLVVMSLSPIVIIVTVIIVWVVIYLIKYRSTFNKHRSQLYINIITTLVVTLFIIHPSVVQLSIEAFK